MFGLAYLSLSTNSICKIVLRELVASANDMPISYLPVIPITPLGKLIKITYSLYEKTKKPSLIPLSGITSLYEKKIDFILSFVIKIVYT